MSDTNMGDLDKILALAEQKAKEGKRPEELQQERLAEENHKRIESERLKRQRDYKITSDLEKYEKIAANQYAQDIKATAWDALVAAYPEVKNIERYDVRAFLVKLDIELTYTDPINGLMWVRDGNIAGKKMSFNEAQNWVENLNYAGYSDWHLPNTSAFASFAKQYGSRPAGWLDANGFINIQRGGLSFYWRGMDCTIDMDYGTTLFTNPAIANHYVWPVRVDVAAQRRQEWNMLIQKLNNYLTAGNYDSAATVAKNALELAKGNNDAEHPDVAASYFNLALVHSKQGRNDQAISNYITSLTIYEKALGSDHLDVALNQNNLAELYDIQGQYAQAESLYKFSLATREKVLGSNHPDVATSLNNIAVLYCSQGLYAQAEPFFKHSLSIREKVHGQAHPDVAMSLSSLAMAYMRQGDLNQAEFHFKRSLEVIEKAVKQKVVSPKHPLVTSLFQNVAALYRETKQQSAYSDLEKRFAIVMQ